MDAVAEMLREELMPRSNLARAEEFLKIAGRAKQWSCTEKDLQRMFKSLIVDTRTMHGQVGVR